MKSARRLCGGAADADRQFGKRILTSKCTPPKLHRTLVARGPRGTERFEANGGCAGVRGLSGSHVGLLLLR